MTRLIPNVGDLVRLNPITFLELEDEGVGLKDIALVVHKSEEKYRPFDSDNYCAEKIKFYYKLYWIFGSRNIDNDDGFYNQATWYDYELKVIE